jgi:tetratricopeptide (TPR) repeat protein
MVNLPTVELSQSILLQNAQACSMKYNKSRMDSDHLDETRPVPTGEGEQPPEVNRPASSDQVTETGAETKSFSPVIDTTPVKIDLPETGSELPESVNQETGQPKPSRSWLLWAILSLTGLIAIAILSIFAGYRSAIEERTNHQATQVAGEALAQFALALQDLETNNYDLARQRLEYIIQLNPGYPGASDKLAEVLLQLRITATPTTAPTPSLTPTPDLRGRDELYNQAQLALLGGDWDNAIDTLLTLRKKFPDFLAIKVDGMLFVALRNRGVDKIARHADLEGGTYDLTLAERFGPLDGEAKNWRDWAELYIRGASFWDVDWNQAVFFFSQLALTAPNLVDGSGWTALERYYLALLGYGDWLVLRGEWCLAQEQFRIAQELKPDPQVEPTAAYVDEQCASGAPPPDTSQTPPAPTSEGGLPGEVTPTPEIPTETPNPYP